MMKPNANVHLPIGLTKMPSQHAGWTLPKAPTLKVLISPRHMLRPSEINWKQWLGLGLSLLWQPGLKKQALPSLRVTQSVLRGWAGLFRGENITLNPLSPGGSCIFYEWCEPLLAVTSWIYLKNLMYASSFLGSPSYSFLTSTLGKLVSFDSFKEWKKKYQGIAEVPVCSTSHFLKVWSFHVTDYLTC